MNFTQKGYGRAILPSLSSSAFPRSGLPEWAMTGAFDFASKAGHIVNTLANMLRLTFGETLHVSL
jgi:hypothetical protein